MQVIGQDNRGDDFERPIGTRDAKRCAQFRDVVHKQRPFTLLEIHGKEIGSARNPDAAVIGHDHIVAIDSPDRSRRTPLERVGKTRQADPGPRRVKTRPTERV